jgi:hypothetical protein
MARKVLLLAVLLGLLATSASASLIVQNGGFTVSGSPSLADWTVNPCTGCTGVDWTATVLTAVNADLTPPPSGNPNAAYTGCMNSGNCVSNYIWQSLTTVAGQTYTLSFYSNPAGHQGSTESPTELDVYWNGSLLGQLINQPTEWLESTYTVTATSTSTVLGFSGRDDPYYLFLTDVSVTPMDQTVPEPLSLTLIGSGLLGLSAIGGILRRRRKA